MFQPFEPPTTSTPNNKLEDLETSTFREGKWNKIIEKVTIDGRRKKSLAPKKSRQEKENYRRSKLANANRKYSTATNHLTEKRRQQAIESMQIAEKRRLRILTENKAVDELADEIAKMALATKTTDRLPDGRLKLTKKQLAAREMKQERIRKHFEAQERRKKKVSFCKQIASYHRLSPRKFTPRKKAVKPAETVEEAKSVEKKEETTEKKTEAKPIIRYTKQQLLDLCPYGTYFFR